MKKLLFRTLIAVLGLLVLLVVVVVSLFLTVNRTNGEIRSADHLRRYLLYVPETYDPARPTPLVISLHGFAEWPAHQMRISHWNDVAEENGFIVVYPSGTGFPLRWNAYNRPDARVSSDEEVQFIADLIDKLSEEYNLDPARIYANGLSNGAGISFLLACKLSDRITAFGGVSGAYLLPWEDCNPTRPVPVIFFQGDKDPIVPYEGGEYSRSGSRFPFIPEWVDTWAKKNQCNSNPETLPGQGEVSGIKYSGCDQDAEVVFYTVHGGGHAWPGGEALPEFIVGHTTQDIDATRKMWEFFSRYSLGK